MKHIHRRDVLRGGGVAALAAGAACVPSMAMARPSVEDQVLLIADNLLNDKAGLTCGEWIERRVSRDACRASFPAKRRRGQKTNYTLTRIFASTAPNKFGGTSLKTDAVDHGVNAGGLATGTPSVAYNGERYAALPVSFLKLLIYPSVR